jgi:hypothetical protein
VLSQLLPRKGKGALSAAGANRLMNLVRTDGASYVALPMRANAYNHLVQNAVKNDVSGSENTTPKNFTASHSTNFKQCSWIRAAFAKYAKIRLIFSRDGVGVWITIIQHRASEEFCALNAMLALDNFGIIRSFSRLRLAT